jgi:hemerythrin-like domain-containing protein
MCAEHEQGRALLRRMREDDARVLADAIGLYARLLRAHIGKENNILFHMAERVVPEAEQRALGRAFEEIEHVTVGPGGRDRLFAELARLQGGVEP